MRSLLCLAITLFLFTGKVLSQTYALTSTLNGQTINTCSGTFYDSSPGDGTYGHNQDYTVTFCPGTANRAIRLDFFLMDLAFNDSMIIYDGANTSAPVLITFDYLNLNANSVVATNAAGCLTIRFKSDNASTARGWQATIRCAQPCQAFSGTLVTTPPADANGIVNVCLGDFITLAANITYPNNGTNYTQSNALSTFRWKTGFSNDTSGLGLHTITKRIVQQAGYKVRLTVTDTNGCKLDTVLNLKVRSSAKPLFKIAQPPAICLGDTATMQSNYTLAQGAFAIPPFSGKSLFLPDGVGITHSDTIKISDFSPGQTLTNINQFLGVFMTMEHSYLGDLEIKLVAPNGAVITLKQNPGGAGTFLGEPVDNEGQPGVSGVGYQYGFTNSPTYGTMVAEAGAHTHTFTDVLGTTYTNASYLPAGNYTPVTPLTALLGTPLNGNWIIQIKDYLAIDNGYIFNWRLSFANTLYPNLETYSIGAKTIAWQPTAGLVYSSGVVAKASPATSGNFNYTFRIVDSANCTYDTIVKVTVNPNPNKPNLGDDKIMCTAGTIPITVLNIQGGVQYTWGHGGSGTTTNVSQLGTYTIAVRNVFNCFRRDTINVVADPSIGINLGNDVMYCASGTNILQPTTTGALVNFNWSNGSTGNSLQINSPGTYWVQGTTAASCSVRDTIVVTDNPINSWTMPPDSSICGSDMLVTISNAPAGTNFTWYDAAGGNAHWFSVSGTYTTTADYVGCLKQDDITLVINPVPQLSLGNDTMFCASSPNVLQPDIFGAVTTYQWNNNSNNTTLPISGTGLYWLEVSTANGCKARDTINVIDNPINNWQAPADTSICGNNLFVALSNFPAGTNFTWSDAVTGSTRNFNSSGSFGITADHAGCLKLDAMDVGVHPVPTISLGNDTMYCASSPNILQPATTGSIASYQWNNGGAASSLPITNTGMYWLEVTTDMGCKARDTVNVANNPINNWLAPNDTSICGTSHQVVLGNYPAGTTFAWFDASTANNRVFTTSGNYTITANYIGCLKQDAIDVGVHPIPVVNLGNDTMYCATNPNVLQSTITGNISGLTWNTGATAASLPITANGTYWLEANTAFGCKHRDTIIVTNNPLNAWRALADTSICDETVYNASLKNYPAGTDFTWYDGTKGASHSFDSAGSYKVLADLIGCLKQDSVAVAVRPLPVVEVGNDSTLCYGFTMPLKVYHPGASYLWSNGRTDSAITAGQGGIIWAQATLNGCSYRDSMTLAYVDCSCNVSIPNAFSPNGDGVNDVFKVHIECVPKDYVLTVYNRFGQTIFRTSDIAKGWNGKLKQSEMPVGTYYYVLTYFNEGQQKKELYKGYVVLLK